MIDSSSMNFSSRVRAVFPQKSTRQSSIQCELRFGLAPVSLRYDYSADQDARIFIGDPQLYLNIPQQSPNTGFLLFFTAIRIRMKVCMDRYFPFDTLRTTLQKPQAQAGICGYKL